MTTHNIQFTGMPYFPGIAVGKIHVGIDSVNEKCIAVITQDVIAELSVKPAGIIVVEAAPLSHTMIALLGLGVPTVLINEQQAALLEDSAMLLIDGSNGRITNQLESVGQDEYNKQITSVGKAVLMADGELVNLCASVRQPAAARKAVELGARAIGLARSEFLLPANDRVPNTAFYQTMFRDLCEAASPLAVTYRLLDVAADKIPAWMPQMGTLGQALGLQGVRLYHIDSVQDVISAQLEALSGLSTEFSLRLLIPYIVRREEYEHWLTLIRQQLSAQVPIGAMAETPASVLDISNLFECADFVAIGCNDLMQALFAADRDKPELRYYLDPYAPLLFRLFSQIAHQSSEHLSNIQLCGVLAQIQGVLPVLLGLGYRTFSVDPPFIPFLANIVVNTTRGECEQLAAQVCMARKTQEVLEILQLPTDRHPPF